VVLLEAAACVQILAILAFSIVDVGFAYRDKLTLNSAVRGTTRVIANAGTAVDADYQGIITLRGALGSIPQAQVDRVVVYKADVNGNPTNPNCLLPAAEALHGYINDCNVYSASEIFTAPAKAEAKKLLVVQKQVDAGNAKVLPGNAAPAAEAAPKVEVARAYGTGNAADTGFDAAVGDEPVVDESWADDDLDFDTED
jgi:hypothetical protein